MRWPKAEVEVDQGVGWCGPGLRLGWPKADVEVDQDGGWCGPGLRLGVNNSSDLRWTRAEVCGERAEVVFSLKCVCLPGWLAERLAKLQK